MPQPSPSPKPKPKPNPNPNAMQTRPFVIRPDAQNDIYYVLHSRDDPIMPNTMIAHIPNYKTSVMMNALFRNIKENRNLDALEESDDEDEVLMPLVDLNKCMPMLCAFNHRFKRWQPVGLQPV
jgi:L-ascorbate metabolism protein UlaG (beta-lactamase superfamily)